MLLIALPRLCFPSPLLPSPPAPDGLTKNNGERKGGRTKRQPPFDSEDVLPHPRADIELEAFVE
jgi:hypothetical protein